MPSRGSGRGSPKGRLQNKKLSLRNGFQRLWPRSPKGRLQNKVIIIKKCLPEALAEGTPFGLPKGTPFGLQPLNQLCPKETNRKTMFLDFPKGTPSGFPNGAPFGLQRLH